MKNMDDSPWEDSLILAFRDLQWRITQRRASIKFDRMTTREELAKLITNNDLDGLTDLIRGARNEFDSQPPLLAKLDGSAESAAADVITRDGARLFLLEFKSDKGKNKTEFQKFIHVLMNQWEPTTSQDLTLVQTSRRGHFAIYPEAEQKAAQTTSMMAGLKMETKARCYYDFSKRKNQSNPSDRPGAKESIDALKLFTHRSIGLSFGEMAAYLRVLSDTHKNGSNERTHPMKVVMATNDGMFWPFGDLSDFLNFSEAFMEAPQGKIKAEKEFDALLPLIEPGGSRHAAKVKEILDSFKKKEEKIEPSSSSPRKQSKPSPLDDGPT